MPDQIKEENTLQRQKTLSERKLAAIMFTDIVGYTALMGKDSAKALDLVKVSKEIQKPVVIKHNGKWLKEMGDGVLVQFTTALDAVNCAIEIQEQARAKFDGKLRIGIHSGDITIENEDVYGDGVNIASRLESIADPGGIYISESVEKSIRGQTNIQAKYLGEINLKNVDYGVRTYALQGVGLPVPQVKEEKRLSGHFWAEIQRRGLIRTVITYIIISFLSILVFQKIEFWVKLPGWSLLALLIVLIVFFPVAMYLAWTFERSPVGFVRTTSQQSWQNPLKNHERKPFTSNLVIGSLLLITILIFSYPKVFSGLPATNEKDVKRFHILFPEQAPLSLLGESQAQWSYSSMALSPDGKILVYAGWKNGRSLLYLRYIEKTEVIPIEGTEGAYGPFFSPDGKWIAFSTQAMLRKVMVPDGSPVDITPVTLQSGAVWTKNDNIIFSNNTAIFRVSSRGGTAELISTRNTDRVMDVVGGYTTGIDITPDQKHILFSDLAGEIYSLNLQSGKTTSIYPMGGGSPKFIASGHLIFSRNNDIFAVPFNVKTMKPMGRENQIINGIRTERSGPQLTYANDGTAIHIPGNYYQFSSFSWIDKNGNKHPVNLEPDNYGSFELSPDGNLLAICMLPAQDHIKVYDFRTSQITRVKVSGIQRLYSPVWGPDNNSIIFGAHKDNSWHLFRKEINKVREAEQLGSQNQSQWPYSWSESGKYITVLSNIIEISPDLSKTKIAGQVANGNHMTLSPNDDYVVYGSDESGQSEIYVQPFPATGEIWQLSTDGGTDPIWTKDGRSIYYHNDLRIYSVKINSFEPFDYDTPRVYYGGPFINAVSRSLGVGRDQDKVLILEQVRGSQLARQAIVTLNWFEELKRLAPADE